MKDPSTSPDAARPSLLYVEDDIGDFNNLRAKICSLWPDAHITHVNDFSAKSVARELKRCEREGHAVDVILLDLHQESNPIDDPLQRWSGLRLLQELRVADHPAHWMPIVACTNFDDRNTRTQGRSPGVVFMAHGGTDFIEKTEIAKRTADVSWHHRLRNHVIMARRLNPRRPAGGDVRAIHGTLDGAGKFIGELREQIRELVQNGTRFLSLHGETGVGKGKAVGYIKFLLGLSDDKTAEIQLSTIPESLLEGYLFGHCKGAFTGATETRSGALEGKTLIYLDEFQRIPLHIQAKLLRVLRERYFHRVGEPDIRREIPASAVFVVSLDATPDVLVRRGVLAPDIAGRLPLSQLEISPLRARKDEIEALVHVFIDRRRARTAANERQTPTTLGIDSVAAKAIARSSFDWPYNIAQLEAFVEYLCDSRTSNVITQADVQRGLQKIMGSEVELALRLFRRYAFDRTLTAQAWGYLGRPGTTYMRDDRNMNTFSVRRTIARIASDVASALSDHEDRLMAELLGPERFDPMMQSIVNAEVVDLRTRISAATGEKDLAELVRAAQDRPWRHVLVEHRAAQPKVDGEASSLAKVFNYTNTIPPELWAGIGLLLALAPAALARFDPYAGSSVGPAEH